MFEKSTLDVTQTLIGSLKSLTPVVNTPIATLTRAICEDGIESDAEGDVLSLLAGAANERNSAHTEAMAELAHTCAQSIRTVLQLSRNVINPHLKTVIEIYDGILKDTTTQAVSPYIVNQFHHPEIYTDPVINDMLSRYSNVTKMGLLDKIVQIGHYEREDIMRLLSVSDQRDINLNLRELLTADDNSGLIAVTNLLNGKVAAIDVLRHKPELSFPLAVILEAIEEPTEGVTKTLSEWQADKSLLLNNAINVLKTYGARVDADLSNKFLYDNSKPRSEHQINVNGAAYLHYIEKGLTVNALIGHEILGRPFSGEKILENIEVLEKAYQKEHLALEQAFRIQLNTTKALAMVKAVRADAENRIKAGEFVLEGDTAEKVRQRVNATLEGITQSNFKFGDQILNITAAVMRIWYYHTGAPQYMDYRLEVEREGGGNLTAPEIATLATVRYVVRWCLSQTTVVGE